MSYQRSNYGHRDPLALRQETEDRIAERERKLDLHSDTCKCRFPCRGPSRMGEVRCLVCVRVIR